MAMGCIVNSACIGRCLELDLAKMQDNPYVLYLAMITCLHVIVNLGVSNQLNRFDGFELV